MKIFLKKVKKVFLKMKITKKREYCRKRNKNLSEDGKQKLAEYRTDYYIRQEIRFQFFSYKRRWKCNNPRVSMLPVSSYKSTCDLRAPWNIWIKIHWISVLGDVVRNIISHCFFLVKKLFEPFQARLGYSTLLHSYLLQKTLSQVLRFHPCTAASIDHLDR